MSTITFHMTPERLLKPDGEWWPIFQLPQRHGCPVIVKLTDGTEREARIVQLACGWTLEGADIRQVQGWKRTVTGQSLGATESILKALLEERGSQVALGFTAEHDDCHRSGELIETAIAYANHARGIVTRGRGEHLPRFKPSATPTRDLIKAAALLIAEIERRSRLPQPPAPEPIAA